MNRLDAVLKVAVLPGDRGERQAFREAKAADVPLAGIPLVDAISFEVKRALLLSSPHG